MNKTLVLLLPIILISGCLNKNNTGDKINQQSPLYSPGGKYLLNVSVVNDEKEGFEKWWQLEITNKSDNTVFVDNNNFPGRFNIYWNWDRDDRIWFFNSDDGSIYYWEFVSDNWIENRYDRESSPLALPDNFLPEYAKAK